MLESVRRDQKSLTLTTNDTVQEKSDVVYGHLQADLHDEEIQLGTFTLSVFDAYTLMQTISVFFYSFVSFSAVVAGKPDVDYRQAW